MRSRVSRPQECRGPITTGRNYRSFGLLVLIAVFLLVPLSGSASAGYEFLLAPTTKCPNQSDPSMSTGAQERVMLCMHDYARKRARSLPALASQAVLKQSSNAKSADILRCDDFSHTACGRRWTYHLDRVGYPPPCRAENIGWGAGFGATVRSIMTEWLNSDLHRPILLSGRYRQIGLGLRRGTLEVRRDGRTYVYRDAHVWTAHFGSRQC